MKKRILTMALAFLFLGGITLTATADNLPMSTTTHIVKKDGDKKDKKEKKSSKKKEVKGKSCCGEFSGKKACCGQKAKAESCNGKKSSACDSKKNCDNKEKK